jgi:hypothetical protein
MKVLNVLLLVICFGVVGIAQTAATERGVPPAQAPAAQTPAPGPVVIETDAREVREQFEALLSKYPPEVGRILKMDPTMLANEAYLQQYPAVQQFLAAHPEIVRNPGFYLEFVRQSFDFTRPTDPRSRALDIWDSVIEGVGVFAILAFVSAMIAWLVKTVLNHRRWVRTSTIQNEVHNKILDRFAGTNELLTYVQSPAGRRFLEAAPIPLDAGERPVPVPLSRILWSVQAGIVLMIGGLGFQYVSGRVIDEVAQGLWTIGVLATAFGLGFVAAGAFSFVMSRRLGLLDPPTQLRNVERGDTPVL